MDKLQPQIKTPEKETAPVAESKVKSTKFPTEIVQLPSKGLLYPADHPLSSGQVEIKYMTAKEEDILSTQSYIKRGVVLDKLCEAVIMSKGVKFDDLLIGDKNAILFAARAYGYGPEYETKVNLGDGNTLPITIDLLNLEYNYLDDSLVTPHENRFQFTLPKSGQVIEFKLLTVSDQKIIDQALKNYKKVGGVMSSQALTTRFRYMVLSVDGDESKSVINPFVENMLAADSRAFREYIAKITPDVKLEIEGEDPDTGEPFRSNFEIGVDLFYPDYKG